MNINSESSTIKIDEKLVKSCIKQRSIDSYKGTYGTLLNISGSYTMPGACFLSSYAAIKTGVGILNIALPKSIYQIIASKIPEPIFTILNENRNGTICYSSINHLSNSLKKVTACLIGCGLGVNEDTTSIVNNIITTTNVPLVIDADGLNCICNNIEILKEAKSPIIVTPHPKEMSRLLNTSIENIQGNRIEASQYFAEKYNVIVVLKGHDTLITTFNRKVYINKSGNPGMAKGGSGDVLAGIIASLLAQGIKPEEAAYCGTWLHGVAGDRCASKYSQISMLPRDIIDELQYIFLMMDR